MSNEKRYYGSLWALMRHKHGIEYPRGTVFSLEERAAVTAEDVVAFFNFKAYGKSTPSDDDRPTLARSNALLDHKKALSFFMPNRNWNWNELTRQGNPTKSHRDAVDRIYTHYGPNLSPTAIINALRKDKASLPPMLRV